MNSLRCTCRFIVSIFAITVFYCKCYPIGKSMSTEVDQNWIQSPLESGDTENNTNELLSDFY